METVTDFIFWGSKITADGDCSHEIKRCLLLGRKAMTKLESILKVRDITLPTKVHLVKAMVFPVVKYRYESQTIKKPECQRIGASASSSVLPMNIQDWFPLELTGLISLQSLGLSRVFSNTTVQITSDFIGGGAPKSLQMVTAAMKLKDTYSLEEKLWPT